MTTYELNDATTLPHVGFGTYPVEDPDVLVSALEVGYRLLDTAVNYGNEEVVGEALRRFVDRSDVTRDEVVVATKIPGRHHAYDDARASIRASRERLGVERTDLHLIHWPNPSVDQYVEAWRALVDAQAAGEVRSIGVSNFTPAHLARIIDDTGVTPAVNQVEMHPYFPQVALRAAHAELGIRTEAWSPLGKRQAPFEEPAVAEAARAHGVAPGQVIVRWHLQLDSLPIPKATARERQQQNLDVEGFTLSDDEIAAITALGREDGRLFGGDPDTHEEM